MKITYITFEEVLTAYLDCRKHKRNTEQQLEFEINLWGNLYSIYYDLNKFNYTLQESIAFIVKRPVIREVFAAKFRDRIIHHVLYNKINHIFEKYIFIDDCYACRKDKGTLYGIKRCYDKIQECSNGYKTPCYILKGDLKSFFMTIDKRRLYSISLYIIKKYGNCTENEFIFINYLLKLIIFNCPQNKCTIKGSKKLWGKLPKEKSLFNCDEYHGIPIGNLMSQILANVLLSVLDWYVTKELCCEYYGRYVDDFYIIHKDKEYLMECKKKIRNKLQSIGVILHPNKTYCQFFDKGLTFLGSVIKPNRIYIINRTKGNFYWRIYNMVNNPPKDKDDIKQYMVIVNSYLGLFRQFKTYNIRKKLILNYGLLSLEFYYIKNDFKSLKIKNAYKR